MATLTPSPRMQFFDANGNPLVGGKLYTYAAGTTTPLATYTDSGAGTPNTNPIILDSRGEASVWLGASSYYMELKSSADVLQWSSDNIGGVATLTALAASGGSAMVGFLQAGSSAVATTSESKMRESVSVFDFMSSAEKAEVQSGLIPTTDITAKFDAAVARLRAIGGGVLLIPPGKYCGRLRITSSNIEVIGYGAEIGYQNVDATLQVYPPNPGNAIPFNYSFIGGINAGVPNNVSPNATLYQIDTVTQGSDTISVLSSSAGLVAGDWCMLMAGQVASSSINNHIPINHQLVQVRSVSGLNVTLEQVSDVSFTGASGQAYLAKWTFLQNIAIRGCKFNNYAGGGAAYLYAICGTYGILIEDVLMFPATGLGIFSTCENATLRNVNVVSGQGGFSNGRMCDKITVDDCRVDLTSSEGFNQYYFFFSEENVKKLNIHSCKGLGGGVVISSGSAYTNVSITDSNFDVFNGPYALSLASCTGGFLVISNSTFAAVNGQQGAPFPPATPSVCIAIYSSMVVQFSNSAIIQLGTGSAYVSAFGSISPTLSNTYVNSGIPSVSGYVGLIDNITGKYKSSVDILKLTGANAVPSDVNSIQFVQYGTFTPTFKYSTAGDSSFAYSTQVGTYQVIGREVTLKLALKTSAHTFTTAAGPLLITGIPIAIRPSIDSSAAIGIYAGITSAARQSISANINNSADIYIFASGSGVAIATIDAGTNTTSGVNIDVEFNVSYIL